jgi:peroxiredoxin family protein
MEDKALSFLIKRPPLKGPCTETEMVSNPLFILLCSGEHEKLQMAANIASIGAVSDRPVRVFVSMNAILAFAKDTAVDKRYQGGVFSRLLNEKHAPNAVTLFQQGKEFGDLKIWACSMALDIQGWEMRHLVEGLFDGTLGLTKFLSDAENGQFITI